MLAEVSALASEPSVPSHVCYVVADRNDDIITIRQKLAEVSGQRVALVLHNKSNAFDSPVAVHLLARAATQESLAMAIVTRRGWTLYWAAVEGIMTYRHVSQVPREVSPDDAFGHPLASAVSWTMYALYRSASWLIAFASVLALLGLAFLIVPRAVVQVEPVTTTINATVPVGASVNTTSATNTTVPARVVYLLVTTHNQIPVTHDGQPLDGRAIGYVTFENRTSDRQTIPGGTEVSTFSGVNYHTLKQVVLDPRPGATAKALIRADYAGPASDAKRGDVLVIQGNLHWFAAVVNEDVITGGGTPGTPIVTGLDSSKLLAQATDEAQQQARQQLANLVGQGEQAVPESIQVTPIQESFDHQPGDVASSLGLEAQFRVSALIVNSDQVKRTALANWQPSLPNGYVLVGNSVNLGSPVVTKVDNQGASFDVPIQAIGYKAVNTSRLAQYVRLRSPAAAKQEITREFDLTAPPTITLYPRWIGRAYRVDVVVNTNGTPSSAVGAQSSVHNP